MINKYVTYFVLYFFVALNISLFINHSIRKKYGKIAKEIIILEDSLYVLFSKYSDNKINKSLKKLTLQGLDNFYYWYHLINIPMFLSFVLKKYTKESKECEKKYRDLVKFLSVQGKGQFIQSLESIVSRVMLMNTTIWLIILFPFSFILWLIFWNKRNKNLLIANILYNKKCYFFKP